MEDRCRPDAEREQGATTGQPDEHRQRAAVTTAPVPHDVDSAGVGTHRAACYRRDAERERCARTGNRAGPGDTPRR